MSRARVAPALVAAALLLAGCGGGDEDRGEAANSTTTPPTTAASSTARSTTSARPSTSSPSSAPALSPEEEANIVAAITAGTFTENGDALSEGLVKSNSLVEAQTDFRFDQATRTVVLAVTSTYSTDTYVPEMAYDLAANFAPVFWGPEGTGAVRVESLPLFSVTVDESSYLCDAPTMVALAERELSMEMFVDQCGGTR